MNDEKIDVPTASFETKTFNSLAEFRDYYSKNKEHIDSLSTVMLNQLYKIKDYIIRKNHGNIGYRSTRALVKVNSNKQKLEERLTQLETSFNQMVTVVNQLLGEQ